MKLKFLITASTLALLMTPAFAQSSTNSSQAPQATQNSTDNSQPQNAATAQRLKKTLESEGFTDVKVVAQSFVVQGKSPDGDPVLMTIGPHGMSVFEAMNATGSGKTTGSNSNSSTAANSNSTSANPSTKSNSQTQK